MSFLNRLQSNQQQALEGGQQLVAELRNKSAGIPVLAELAAALEQLMNSKGEAKDTNLRVTTLRNQYKSTLSRTEQLAFDASGGIGHRIAKVQDALGWK